MKNNKHKLLTLAALTTIAAGIVHLTNRFVAASAQLKEMLDVSNHNYFEWRFGRVYYTKKGTGSPILLVHDTMPGSSGYEWSRIEDALAAEHTVYTIDLLGCGRSAKIGITYTNFLYVQLLCDFTKKIIGQKTNLIASGFSSSYAVMACLYEKDCFNKIMLVNPTSLGKLSQTPTQKDKLFKLIIEFPIFGTLIYHIVVSRESVSSLFIDKLYNNPFHVDEDIMDAYYESAHKGGYYAKYLYSSLISKYVDINIGHTLQTLDNSIYIVEGENEINADSNVEEYLKFNPAIETAFIKDTKHFPHIENPEAFLEQVGTFF